MFLPSNITLQFGDSGDFVSELQRRMCLVNCYSHDMVNGFYDGNTVNGVSRFQGMVGLHVDGVAGPETLRRLNGVISGGGSATTDDKKEEEKALTAVPAMDMGGLLGLETQQQPDLAAMGVLRPVEAEQQQQQSQATAHAPPQTELPPMQPIHDQQRAQEAAVNAQLQQQAAFQQQTLAAVLQQQPSPQQQHGQKTEQDKKPEHGQHAGQQQQQHHIAGSLQQQNPQQNPQQAPAQATEPQERQGIIGRTIDRGLKFANTMLQKLSDYFESKLPPSTLNEVKEIGMVMAQHGMKETPLPSGPDMVRAPQTPARGPEQAPAAKPQRA